MPRRTLVTLGIHVLCACATFASPFTGTFVADARPSWIALLSITQSGHAVSGFLLIAEPNARGGTSSSTVRLEGAADEAQLTLQTQTFLGLSNVTFVGHLSRNAVILNVPTPSGKIQSATFVRSDESTFNVSLSEWQAQLKTAYARRKRIEHAAEVQGAKAQAARDAAADLVDLLRRFSSTVDNLRQSTDFTGDLDACARALQTMRHFAQEIDLRAEKRIVHI